MAEWCEHDDIIIHVEIGGKRVAVHVKIEGYTEKATMRAWQHDKDRNVRAADSGEPDTIGVQVIGPPCPWRVKDIYGNHGYMLDNAETEYAPDQTVVFTLSVDDVPF